MDSPSPLPSSSSTETSFLAGLASGAEVAKLLRHLPVFSKAAGKPANANRNHPLDHWGSVVEGNYEDESAQRLAEYYGIYRQAGSELFDCRSKLVCGSLRASQLRGLAAMADQLGTGHLEFSHHGEVRIRGVKSTKLGMVLEQFVEQGLHPLGAGGDGCRGVVCNSLSGIDGTEAADVRPLARRLQILLQHERDAYCLPNKFRIGIDGGGRLPLNLDYFDLSLRAIVPSDPNAKQLNFTLRLGGSRSIKRTAQLTSISLTESQVIPFVIEILRLYGKYGDRVHGDRSRLCFLIDEMGIDTFLEVALCGLNGPWQSCPPPLVGWHRPTVIPPPDAWIGQKQKQLFTTTLEAKNGMLNVQQCFSLANVIEQFGTAELRLSPDRNLFVVGICAASRGLVRERLHAIQAFITEKRHR